MHCDLWLLRCFKVKALVVALRFTVYKVKAVVFVLRFMVYKVKVIRLRDVVCNVRAKTSANVVLSKIPCIVGRFRA